MTASDFEKSILDDDGSCREITFECPTWPGVERMLLSIAEEFESGKVVDRHGRPVSGALGSAVGSLVPVGGIADLIGGTGPISSMQVFVGSDGGLPFVELTFRPTDVRVKEGEPLRNRILEWVDTLLAMLQARRYYIRYENVSWSMGDLCGRAGVFYVSDKGDVLH